MFYAHFKYTSATTNHLNPNPKCTTTCCDTICLSPLHSSLLIKNNNYVRNFAAKHNAFRRYGFPKLPALSLSVRCWHALCLLMFHEANIWFLSKTCHISMIKQELKLGGYHINMPNRTSFLVV